MSDQPPTQTPTPEPVPQKLEIDDPTNFVFHAAYMVYAESFQNASGIEAKRDLNQNIQDLKDGKISAEAFYRNVAHYRGDVLTERRRDRFTVQTQRKKDWRMKSQKQERIRRHKK